MLTNAQTEVRNKVVHKMETGDYPLVKNPCLCGKNQDVLIATRDRYNIPIKTMLCTACGLMRSDPYYNEKALSEFYKNDYRQLYTGNEQATESFFTEQKGFGKYIYDFLSGNIFKPEIKGKKIFEVGCGAGGILETFREHNNEVFGCDYGETYIEFGKQKGLNLVAGDSSSLLQFGKADIIILNHTLEHMKNPQRELLKIRELLSPGGLLYIALPGIYSIHDTYRGNLMGYLQNAHIWYFTLKTLNSLLAKSGFQMIVGNEIIMSAYKISESNHPLELESYEKIQAYLKKIKNLRWYYNLKKFSPRHTAFETLRKFPVLYRVTRTLYRKLKKIQ